MDKGYRVIINYLTPIRKLKSEGKHSFYYLFDHSKQLTFSSTGIAHLFEDSWKYGIKAAGIPKQMFYSQYEDDGCEHTWFKEHEIEVGNIKFSNLTYGKNECISVKINNEWITVYNRNGYYSEGWLYPIETQAIQEIFRFLKALANTVDMAKERDFKIKQKQEKEENQRIFEEFIKKKNKLDSFNINLNN